VARTARRLAALGVAEGDRIATTLPASLDFVLLLHALPRLGAVLVPLDPRQPAEESRRRAEACGARLVVAQPLGGDERDVPLRDSVEPDAVHTLLHTSGTTAAPKPVELTYRNHAASAQASAAILAQGHEDRWLCAMPLFHVAGLAILLRSVIFGSAAIVHNGFTAPDVRDSLVSGEVTLTSLAPTMLRRVVDAGLDRAPAVRAALLGGGPIPPDLLDWAVEHQLPVMPTYGLTETGSQVVTIAPEEALRGERAGRPLEGVQLAIATTAGLTEAGPSESGEVLVRGEMVAPGSVSADGWLHTGDRGHLDVEGRLHLEGRFDDLIVTGGENVMPEEVENALRSHSAVADVAVAGRPDPEWGSAVTAYVVFATELPDSDLLAHARERLAPYKLPKRIVRVRELPRNAAGKLRRHELPR
jgi:o-succinylbenzoate---CoA ligase